MKKSYSLFNLMLCFVLLFATQGKAQTTLNTTVGSTGYTGTNGAGAGFAITFAIENLSGSPIMLTDVANYWSSGQNGIAELWYSSTSLGGSPTPIAGPTWTMIASNNVTVPTTGVTPAFTGLSFIIPNGAQYRFALYSAAYCAYSGTGVGTCTPNTFTSGGVSLKVGDVSLSGGYVGYGGSNNPRFFTGSVTFVTLPPCTSPPTAGTSTASPSNACAASPVQLGLSGTVYGQGITYQWQTGPSATGPWTNVGGSLSGPGLTINPTASAYYRCGVTCGTSTSYATPVQVTVPALFPGGTYTINSALATGGTNFQTFGAAVAAISCGISGPVVFNVDPASGPYTEQINIPNIATTSAVNTVTFNCNNRVLNFNSSNTNDRAGITLNGADFIRFNGLKINATGTYGFGVHMTADANNNIINNCTIDVGNNATSSNYAGICIGSAASGATSTGTGDCDSNTISNCTVIGGYYGVTMLGTSGTPQYGNKLINNIIKDQYFYRTYNLYLTNSLFQGNDLSNSLRTTYSTFYGLYISTGCFNNVLNANKIHDPFPLTPTSTSTVYGLYCATGTGTVAPNIISNNILYNLQGNGTQYIMYNSSGAQAKYYYNTVCSDYAAGNAGTHYGFYQVTASTGIEFKNNIISNTRGGGTKYCMYFSTTGATFTGNNNVYYVAGGGTNTLGRYNGSDYATLAAWQTATAQDANSVSVNPLFTAAATGNLLPTEPAVDNIATPIAGINSDILSNQRSPVTPDPGAFEKLPVCNAPANLNVTSITTTSAVVSWSVLGSPSLNYEYAVTTSATPPASGTSTTGTVQSISGLTPGTTYYLHVRSYCGASSLTPFSVWTTVQFQTSDLNCAVSPSALAATNITYTSADLSWNAIGGVAGYEYIVNQNVLPPTVAGTFTAGTSFNTGTTLNAGTAYYLHVRTQCAGPTYSSWTTMLFHTLSCDTPSTSNVINTTVNSTTVWWNAVPGVLGYEYVVTTATTPPATGTFTTNLMEPVTGLNAGTTYYLYVRTNCDVNIYSGWSKFTFTTLPCSAPPATAGSITYNSAVLNWSSLPGALGYEYSFGTTATPPATGTATTALTFSPGATLTPNTTYYFHVRAQCGPTTYSPWTTITFKTLVCLPPVGLSITNITTGSATLNWGMPSAPSSAASGYEYIVDKSNAVPGGSGIYNPLTTVTVTNESVTPFNTLTADTWYYVHVRSVCYPNAGYSDWVLDSFKTRNPCPPVTGLKVENVWFDAIDVLWNTAPYANYYQYSVGTTSAPPSVGTNITDTTFRARGLKDNSFYYIHVRSMCTDVPTSPWQTVTFRTTGLSVSNVAKNNENLEAYPNPVTDKVTVRWNGKVKGNASLQLTDVAGKVLKTITMKGNSAEIDMTAFSAAIYFVRYIDDEANSIIKINKD